MAEPKSFLDNLNNLRLVMSVALEHIQANLTPFVKDRVRINCDNAIGLSAKSELLPSISKENSTRLII